MLRNLGNRGLYTAVRQPPQKGTPCTSIANLSVYQVVDCPPTSKKSLTFNPIANLHTNRLVGFSQTRRKVHLAQSRHLNIGGISQHQPVGIGAQCQLVEVAQGNHIHYRNLYPWVPMGTHGYPWALPVGIAHGYPWAHTSHAYPRVPMGNTHGFPMGTPWVPHGYPLGTHAWVPMARLEEVRGRGDA